MKRLLDETKKANEPKESRYLRGRSAWESVKAVLSSAVASLTKVEFIVRALDGVEDMGTAWDMIFRPIAEAEDREHRMSREYSARLKELFDKHYTKADKKAFTKKYYDKFLKKNVTREQLLALALNSGNKLNLERVLTGEGWKDYQLVYVWGQLTRNDWEFVQGVWDLIDTMWPRIADLQRDITGMEPEKVEALGMRVKPKDSAPGDEGMAIRGGYYPIAYDADESRRVRELSEKQIYEDLFETQYARAATRHGHTEARARSTGLKLKLDLSVISKHFNQVIHDLAFRRAVIDVDKITRSQAVQNAITAAAGDAKYSQIRPWLQNIARGGEIVRTGTGAADYIDRAAAVLRRRTQVTVIGFKLASGISQTMGYISAAQRVGAPRLARHIYHFARNPMEWGAKAREVYAKSEFIRNRSSGMDRDIRATVLDLRNKGQWDDVTAKFFQLIVIADAAVVIPVWNAAYEKGIKKFGFDDKKAVLYADSVVRDTQDVGAPKDLASIQRGSNLRKLLTMFYNSANTQFNMAQEAVLKYRMGKSGKLELLGAFAFLIIIPAIIEELRYGAPDDEDDEDDGTWNTVSKWAKAVAAYPFSFVPGLRDIEYAVEQGYDYTPTPALEAVNAPLRFARDILGAFDEDEIKWKRFTLDGISAAGYVFGLPSGQAKITIGAMFDSFDERYEVKPSDYFFYRRRKRMTNKEIRAKKR